MPLACFLARYLVGLLEVVRVQAIRSCSMRNFRGQRPRRCANCKPPDHTSSTGAWNSLPSPAPSAPSPASVPTRIPARTLRSSQPYCMHRFLVPDICSLIFLYCPFIILPFPKIGIGGAVARSPLPHHRTSLTMSALSNPFLSTLPHSLLGVVFVVLL